MALLSSTAIERAYLIQAAPVWEIANDENVLVAKGKIKGFNSTAHRFE